MKKQIDWQGKRMIFCEDLYRFGVEIVKDRSNEEREDYTLKTTGLHTNNPLMKEGEEFDVFKIRDCAHAQIWRLEEHKEGEV